MFTRLLVSAALLLGAGCRSTLVEKMEDEYAPVMTAPAAGREGRPFIGIVVTRDSPPDSVGIKVERVLSEGPADQAGIRPGDEIRQVNKVPVRNALDLDGVLRHAKDAAGWSAKVTVATNGEERVIELTPQPWTDRLGTLRGAFRRISRSNDVLFQIPLIFAYEHMTIAPDVFQAWTGIATTEPIDYYRDLAFIDLFGVFDFFRTEKTFLAGASRLTIFVRLYTSTSDQDVPRAPGEDKLEVF